MNVRNHSTGTVGYLLNVNFMRLMNDFIYFCVPTVLNSVLLKLNTMIH